MAASRSAPVEVVLSELASPVGTLTLAGVKDVLYYIAFDTETGREELDAFLRRYLRSFEYTRDAAPHAKAHRELEQYFAGKLRRFTTKMHLLGTQFQLQVWTALRMIPYGTTTTYKHVATDVGNPDATRAVGGAVGRNPIPVIIPCHRVIGESGNLVGFGGGIERKKKLLQLEGAILV